MPENGFLDKLDALLRASAPRPARLPGAGARDAVLAWVESPGFAALRELPAPREVIAIHLLEWLAAAGFEIVPAKEREHG